MESGSPRFRLSAMMFGQYFIMGAWVVTLATFLLAPPGEGGLRFPPSYTSWIYSTIAIAGIFSPLLTGFLADRLFAAQKLMGVFHLLGALVLGAAGVWCAYQQPRLEAASRIAAESEQAGIVETTFPVLFGIMLLYSFCSLSTLTLSNVVGMRNLRDPQRSFGGVRLYGTLGWVAAGVCVDSFLHPISPGPLFLAAGSSLTLGVFCFFLPHTPPKGERGRLRDSLGLPAIKLLENGPFLVLILCSMALAVSQQFYAIYANRFLMDLQVPRATTVQTVAQWTEIACMALLPLAIQRFGVKNVLALGLLGLALRNALFATESIVPIIGLALPLHGFGYAFFYVVAATYVDRLAPPHLRASVQGMVTFVTLGGGVLVGNWFAGYVVERYSNGPQVVWAQVWTIPAVMAAAVAAVFLALFRGKDEPAPVTNG